MSHLLKRTKKSCIKLMRKLSNKQIFLKRLEEEDISTDVDVSVEAKEKDVNQNENVTPKKLVSCYKHRKGDGVKGSEEDISKETAKRKLTIHFEELDTDKDVLQSLTSKLFLTADGYEFRRLQQLRSDTSSEIVPYDPHFNKNTQKSTYPADGDDDAKLEVVFEKVKYKEDVRYLRHTPSTCSLDNYIINDEDEDENDRMSTTISNTLTNGKNTNASHKASSTHNMHCLKNDARDFDYTATSTTTTRGLEMHNNQHASGHECSNQEHNHQMQQLHQQQSQQSNHLLPLNVSLGCITDGNHHQLFIGEERDYFYKLTPVVKWDINGNSLEDDDFPDFDLNANSSPAKSSLRSSSTTLETWLEVE